MWANGNPVNSFKIVELDRCYKGFILDIFFLKGLLVTLLQCYFVKRLLQNTEYNTEKFENCNGLLAYS